MPVIQSLLAGLPILLLHLASASLVWLGALALYLWITPHDEFALIRAGNEAAAISLGGAAIGLAAVSYTHLRAHETDSYLVCRLLLEKKK